MTDNSAKKRDRDDLKWHEISRKHIVQNEWIDFRESAFRFPDGTEFAPYYSYSRRDYVVIVPFDEDGNLICVRQYRQGIRQVTTEFPAGGIERSDGKEYRFVDEAAGDVPSTEAQDELQKENSRLADSEDALEAAKRELTEETGYASDDWTHLLTIPSNATIADNYAYIYMAKGCRKVADQSLDATEFLNVEVHTPEEIEEYIHSGDFQQSVHVMAYLLAKE